MQRKTRMKISITLNTPRLFWGPYTSAQIAISSNGHAVVFTYICRVGGRCSVIDVCSQLNGRRDRVIVDVGPIHNSRSVTVPSSFRLRSATVPSSFRHRSVFIPSPFRLSSVTVPSSFRHNGLCSHCPSCSVTFHSST